MVSFALDSSALAQTTIASTLRTSFGNFLGSALTGTAGSPLRLPGAELEELRDEQGIRQQRYLIFATARAAA